MEQNENRHEHSTVNWQSYKASTMFQTTRMEGGDGGLSRLSSYVVFPIFFCFMSVSLGVCYTADDSDESLQTISLYLLGAILICGSIGAAYILGYLIKYRPPFHRSLGRKKSWKIRLLFVGMFCIGILARKIILAVINMQCLSIQSSIEIAEFVFRLINICFTIAQLIIFLIAILGEKTFKDGSYVRPSVLAIIFTNLIFWIVVTVTDSVGKYIAHFPANRTMPVNISLPSLCFYNSSGFHFLEKISPYTLPMNLEFFILSSSCFLLLMSEKQGNFEQDLEESSASGDLPRNFQHVGSLSSRQSLPLPYWVIGIAYVFINTFTFIGTFLLHGNFFEKSKMNFVQNGLELILGINPVIVCALIVIGLYLCSKASDTGNLANLSIKCKRNNILIFCMFSTIAYATIDLFYAVSTAPMRTRYNFAIVLFKNVAFIVEAYYQTLFIHKVDSVLPHIKGSTNFQGRILQFVLLNISLYSLNIWLIDTFCTSLKRETILSSYMWNILKTALNPFIKYFRYQCSFEVFALYQKLKI